MENRWGGGPAPDADELAQLVYLSNLIGRESRLVQPGGGNTSIKVGDALLVKGSGTDLRTVGRDGFTRLSLSALGALRTTDAMPDSDMMRFMARAMLAEGPAPSVETPLHSLLPQRVIAHTHDVPTMSLTNVSDAVAERLVAEVFAGSIVYVPYVRPGFPLAQAIGRIVDHVPPDAVGLALAHHGLVVWGETPRACYERLLHACECDRGLSGHEAERPDAHANGARQSSLSGWSSKPRRARLAGRSRRAGNAASGHLALR
jgi:rhamnose utilization protein RhaD (predicted bifunctional aldolase and dehydrogenase)